jgi:hypothetical protein
VLDADQFLIEAGMEIDESPTLRCAKRFNSG